MPMPMPMPITKALKVISASPGSNATTVRQASPVVAITGPETSATRSRFPDQPETVKVPVVQPIEMWIPSLHGMTQTSVTCWRPSDPDGRSGRQAPPLPQSRGDAALIPGTDPRAATHSAPAAKGCRARRGYRTRGGRQRHYRRLYILLHTVRARRALDVPLCPYRFWQA
jgi:hypothetical protein